MAGYEASPTKLQCMATVSWQTFKIVLVVGSAVMLPWTTRSSQIVTFDQVSNWKTTWDNIIWGDRGDLNSETIYGYLWHLQIPTVTLHTVRMSVKTKYASGPLVTPVIGRTHWCHQMFRCCSTDSTQSLWLFFRWKCIFLHSLSYSEAEKLGDFVKQNVSSHVLK